MFSELTKRFITNRLALIKYSGSAAFYWDKNTDKLVPSGNFMFLVWCQTYYGGLALLPFFYYHLYSSVTTEIIEYNDVDPTELIYKSLAACYMVIINTLVTLCSLMVSIMKDRRREICAFYNGCFRMDYELKSDYLKQNGSSEMLRACIKSGKIYDQVATFACLMSLVPPFVMTCMMFYRIDALHTILSEYFEMTVKFTFAFILIALIYGWACFTLMNTFMTFIFPVLLTSISCTIWIRSAMPIEKVSQTQFETSGLGIVSIDTVISIYRQHQILCCYANGFIAKFRFSLHWAALHILFVVSLFLVIKHFRTFLLLGTLELIGVLFMFIIIVVVIIKMESLLGGAVVNTSTEFRQPFVQLVGRKHYAYKAALSFQRLSVMTTYPLFTVSNDTFLEFLNASVDHIVNLLCIE